MDLVCPLDFRYGREEVKRIFNEDSRLSFQLRVEASLARAHAALGTIPEKAADEISLKATLNHVSVKRVKEIERIIHHDVMAMVEALAEVSGDAGKYVHLGATSYDIVDSANALQMLKVIDILEKDVMEVLNHLLVLAERYRDTVMLGRTHGQYALPITFGLKMAVFAAEMGRHIERLNQCRKEVGVGKMAGAVGSGAAMGSHFFDLQKMVMDDLGLQAEIPSTQIVGRDRYITFLGTLANIAATLEKFATEIRNLQRSEIGEVAEGFRHRQVGSSTMPHKRNPIVCEQISGLARVVRAQLLPAWENAIQWHERDLCNSSTERFIIPHAVIITDWILYRMAHVFANLDVFPEKMWANIERSMGLPMAEAVMMLLVNKGMGRQNAHELMRTCSQDAIASGKHLKDVLMANKTVRELLSENEVLEILNPEQYVGEAKKLVDLTIKKLSADISKEG
jgi:adenylosuccinate lyase